jgi:hypothetical protein
MTLQCNSELRKIATVIGEGPFSGFFTEHSILVELSPPLEDGNCTVEYVVVSGLDGDGKYPAETMAFAVDREGNLDSGVYVQHGAIAEKFGENDPAGLLFELGYEEVITPIFFGHDGRESISVLMTSYNNSSPEEIARLEARLDELTEESA